MVKSDLVFNIVVYAIVIAYILYINFAAYLNKTQDTLNWLINLFQNWIFRMIFLILIGLSALEVIPYGGFILAILLTIAFLNTNMLMYKSNMEKFTDSIAAEYEGDMLGSSENFGNGQDGNCGPYANVQQLPFNPQGYDDSADMLGNQSGEYQKF